MDVGHGFQMYDVSDVNDEEQITRRTRSFTTERDSKKLTVGTLTTYRDGNVVVARDWISFDQVMLYDRYNDSGAEETRFHPLDGFWLTTFKDDESPGKTFRIYTRAHKELILFEINETESGLTPAVLGDTFEDGLSDGGTSGDDPPEGNVPALDQPRREAIVESAFQAYLKHVKAERNKEAPNFIDSAFLGEAILKLKPIRVRNDRVNVAIVLSEKAGTEEGLYVSLPISSYSAGADDRFLLMKLLSAKEDRSFGRIYHYKLQTNAK